MKLPEKNLCSGCGACAQVCGKQAISMQPDGCGFLYPVIDKVLCKDCGLCQKVCPVVKHAAQPMGSAFAAMADRALREESSSGGVFTLIAEHILSQGGIVFGAAFGKDLKLRHIAVESPEQLRLLRGSKYVQSVIGDTYRQSKAALEEGRPVLFTGTPCQVNGLRGFLGKDYENLYCQDIICHGAPAPGVWEKYVAYREKLAGGKAVSVNFRCKDSGWKTYRLKMEFENGAVYSCQANQDPYMQVFLSDLCLRESCYQCSAKGENHTADLTLGDFWGVEQTLPEMFDGMGTSLVLVHTQKGQRLFDAVRESLKCCPADREKAIVANPAMVRSSNRPQKREQFLLEIQKADFQKTVNKYRPKHPIRALKAAIKKLIKQ